MKTFRVSNKVKGAVVFIILINRISQYARNKMGWINISMIYDTASNIHTPSNKDILLIKTVQTVHAGNFSRTYYSRVSWVCVTSKQVGLWVVVYATSSMLDKTCLPLSICSAEWLQCRVLGWQDLNTSLSVNWETCTASSLYWKAPERQFIPCKYASI